jgi:hypothetical protein
MFDLVELPEIYFYFREVKRYYYFYNFHKIRVQSVQSVCNQTNPLKIPNSKPRNSAKPRKRPMAV